MQAVCDLTRADESSHLVEGGRALLPRETAHRPVESAALQVLQQCSKLNRLVAVASALFDMRPVRGNEQRVTLRSALFPPD